MLLGMVDDVVVYVERLEEEEEAVDKADEQGEV